MTVFLLFISSRHFKLPSANTLQSPPFEQGSVALVPRQVLPRSQYRAGPGCLNRVSASIGGPLPGLGCHAEWQRGEVGLIRRAAVKTRMGTPAVIEVEISADRAARLADGVIGPQVHLLVFDAAPEPFDKHVVPPCALAVHADRDAVVGEHACKSLSGELRALIRVEDVRLAVT